MPDIVSYPRRMESSTAALCEPETEILSQGCCPHCDPAQQCLSLGRPTIRATRANVDWVAGRTWKNNTSYT
jgi:hypothetical protein